MSVPSLLPVLVVAACAAQEQTSGAPMAPEQAAFDVLHYDLALRVDPGKETIAGSLGLRAKLLAATDAIVLDLDDRLDVERVEAGGERLRHAHADGRVRIEGGERFRDVGSELELTVHYGGKPRVAPNPPWQGGFTWSRTAKGAPWVATSCQGEGADLWWPCKDQPDDEPESMDLAFTVPDPLVVASNGKLVGVDQAEDGWRTYRWHVSTPINNYGVAFNAAPFELLEAELQSVAGGTFPVRSWVLPENLEAGRAFLKEVLEHLRFFEKVFGPYPFRGDKYGLVETPHLGMEHQSIIAYGNAYSGNPWGVERGFDYLHHHELAHEWWANLVTARNWNDFWIHESFATYAQALYVEELHGRETYLEEMRSTRGHLLNRAPVAPREPRSTRQMYFAEAEGSPGVDIYYKGAHVLHALRYLVGDEDFFRFLRRMAYPDPALEKTTDGSACRFATTDELVALAEEVSGQELGWFFEVYLRRAALPSLEQEVRDGRLRLAWKTPDDLPFPMPVPVRVGDDVRRVELPGGRGEVDLGGGDHQVDHQIDPGGWVLRGS